MDTELLQRVRAAIRSAPVRSEDATELLFAVIDSFAPEFIDGLLTHGANPNAQDRRGMTPLHHAAAVGSRPSIRALVNSGKCDYLIPDGEGRYPFEVAAESTDDFGIVRLLQKKQVQQAHRQGGPVCMPRVPPP